VVRLPKMCDNVKMGGGDTNHRLNRSAV